MILNLDKNFAPIGGQKEIIFQSFIFSGGEPHIKIEPDFDTCEKVTITHRLNSFNDLGLLCVAVDALRRMKVRMIDLFIPYFPAARQDRVMVSGEPLSVKVYADIINAFGLDKVTVYDAHSEVTPAVLNNCEVITNHLFIKKVLGCFSPLLRRGAGGEDISDVKLVSPDGGALKKIYKTSAYLGGMEVVECGKSRDVKTGHLSGFKVYHEDLGGAACLIVDDICDGGATFIGLVDALKMKNAGDLYLAVSHGIFSHGFEGLTGSFKTVFTTDSIRDIEGVEGVRQIKLKECI